MTTAIEQARRVTYQKYFREICAALGHPYSDELVEGWLNLTRSVSIEQFQEAIYAASENGFPTPQKLLQAVMKLSPRDDWDVIMLVATGRSASGQISGYAAHALREVGGIRKLAAADEIGTATIKNQWLDRIAESRPSNALPPANEAVSLAPPGTKADWRDGDQYAPDITGEKRALALIKTLRDGRVKPALARQMLGSMAGHGISNAPGLPSAWRDQVMAVIEELTYSPL